MQPSCTITILSQFRVVDCKESTKAPSLCRRSFICCKSLSEFISDPQLRPRSDRSQQKGCKVHCGNHIDCLYFSEDCWAEIDKVNQTYLKKEEPVEQLVRVVTVSKICPRYAKDMPEICPRFTRDMPKICPRTAQDIPKIRSRFARDMSKICPRYARDMPKICPRYA